MSFFDVAHELLCVATPDGRFTRVNSRWTTLLGWEEDELTSRPFLDFVHPDDVERTIAETTRLAEGHDSCVFSNRYRCRSGEYRWLDWRATADRQSGEIYGAARDVSEERAMRDRLEARERLLSSMVATQLRVRDQEQQRIAGELHDSTVQHAVAAMMFLDGASASADGATAAMVDRAREQVVQSLEATRRVMRGLDPLDLGELGVDEAIRSMARDLGAVYGVPYHARFALDARVDDQVGAFLLRMVREAMVNAGKHAEATRVEVEVRCSDDQLVAHVRDDGRGMQGALGGRVPSSGCGLGLAFVQERARTLGGQCSIDSSSEGTTVTIVLPRVVAQEQMTA